MKSHAPSRCVSRIALAAAVLAAMPLTPTASGATYDWDTTKSGTFSDGANWIGGIAPAGGDDTDILRFGGGVNYTASADSPITFNWFAEPPTGAVINGYRWCVDIENQDIANETPRDGDDDVRHWSTWSLNETAATIGPFAGSLDSTVVHAGSNHDAAVSGHRPRLRKPPAIEVCHTARNEQVLQVHHPHIRCPIERSESFVAIGSDRVSGTHNHGAVG